MASTMKRNTDLMASRGPARKRAAGARSDKDGDISMDTRSRNNNNRVGKSGARGGANRSSLTRNGLNPQALEREALRQASSGESSRPRGRGNNPRSDNVQIRVTGFQKSKVTGDVDHVVGSLVQFLQNKATMSRKRAHQTGRISGNPEVRISKYTIESDNSIVCSVSNEIANQLLRMNGWSFAGANLSIKKTERSQSPQDSAAADNTTKLRNTFTKLIERRYNAETKLLDLSALGQDSDLRELGVLEMGKSTAAKVFPALMKQVESLFTTHAERREKFESVTLHTNELTSVDIVSALAPTLPNLKNLDLSNNQIADLKGLDPWRKKFRSLDHLVLSNNPIEQAVPEYHVEILKWYPSLRFLNTVQVRSDAEAIQGTSSGKKGLPVKPRVVLGDGDITNTFVGMFFPGFDTDRNVLVDMYYDKDSQFSFAVNNHALRDPSSTEVLTKQEWESYIRRSRNFKAITHLTARQSRVFVGQDQIREAFKIIPATRHAAEPEKVLIECQSIPSVPDGTGQYPQGVVGLLITVHGEYEEIDANGQAVKRRSYDRSITLGPGLTTSGLRVINDMMTVRAYGGCAAFEPEQTLTEQDMLVLEFSKHTGMTIEYAKMCLEQSNWDPPTAVSTFESAKATLPPEAFNVITA